MVYPPSVPKEKHFALGHELFGLVPGLFVMGTIWLREHNRVCEVLHREHPEWKDEQIFQTAKLILTGGYFLLEKECMVIMHISK